MHKAFGVCLFAYRSGGDRSWTGSWRAVTDVEQPDCALHCSLTRVVVCNTATHPTRPQLEVQGTSAIVGHLSCVVLLLTMLCRPIVSICQDVQLEPSVLTSIILLHYPVLGCVHSVANVIDNVECPMCAERCMPWLAAMQVAHRSLAAT
jgi:hypothetical protein